MIWSSAVAGFSVSRRVVMRETEVESRSTATDSSKCTCSGDLQHQFPDRRRCPFRVDRGHPCQHGAGV